MLTDSAVPACAVAGTLRPRARLDGVLLERFAFLPLLCGLEQFARRCQGYFIRWQFYVSLRTS